MKTKLQDVPLRRGNRYPTKITIPVTIEMKRTLEEIGKDREVTDLVRMLIEEFLRDLPQDMSA